MKKAGRGLRADVFLVEQGFASSRSQARNAIEAGSVRAGGETVAKSSQRLRVDERIEFVPAHPYVSRGALKLVAGLDAFGFSPAGMTCLDVGASTGGFTQVLLERGASRVFAIDVGSGQLHSEIAANPRVTVVEGVNARELSVAEIPESLDAIVADVSFISLKLALPPALALARTGAWLVALVKPQFEVGRGRVAKGGIVRDPALLSAAVNKIADWLPSIGWPIEGQIQSPIKGGSGNVEYLLGARRG